MTKSSRKPYVVIVDDRPDDTAEEIAASLRRNRIDAVALHPEDVQVTHLRRADVLLVDYDLRDWPQNGVPPSNYCASGWALAAILRDRSRSVDLRRTTTITALLTSQFDEATMPFTTAGREHVSAALNGIEWVFNKTETGLVNAIVALANASLKVHRNWELDDVFRALEANENALAKRDDIIRCRPPLSESLSWQDGLGFVRWMLHSVLPYPTFLVDEYYIAARFGVAAEEIVRVVSGRSGLARKINEHRYQGVLCDFARPRWWRVGVEMALWGLTNGKPSDTRQLRGLIERSRRQPLIAPQFDSGNFVTCYDEQLRPRPLPAESSEAVRIWPDDWPPYASQPWALKSDVTDSEVLRRIAVPFGV